MLKMRWRPFLISSKEMRNIVIIILSAVILASCGQSYEEQRRLSAQERRRLAREDSAALKIAVMPTLDCLPLYVASGYGLFEALGADIRLKPYTAQMDCDTALINGRVEGAVTDIVRGQRMAAHGVKLDYVAATGAYWQLISNRNARIKHLKQLDDKMMAMTRFSATDLLGDYVTDSVKLKDERVFRVQINDVHVRLAMLMNNEMDALWLPEPQATAARTARHRVVTDSRRLGMNLGAIAFRAGLKSDTARARQMDVFVKAYDMACDSINKYGAAHYRDLIARYCKVDAAVADSIPADVRYRHAAPPREEDLTRAGKWLAGKKEVYGKK